MKKIHSTGEAKYKAGYKDSEALAWKHGKAVSKEMKKKEMAKKMKFGNEQHDETRSYKRWRSDERSGIVHKQKD